MTGPKQNPVPLGPGAEVPSEVATPSAPAPGPDLADAEVIARHVSALNPWAGVVMKEYDRMRDELDDDTSARRIDELELQVQALRARNASYNTSTGEAAIRAELTALRDKYDRRGTEITSLRALSEALGRRVDVGTDALEAEFRRGSAAARAELAALREAATALVEHYDPNQTRDFRDYSGELADLLDRLAAVVRGGRG